MKKKISAEIAEKRELAPDICSMVLKTELAEDAHPGQFIGVYPGDGSRLLMRPISICDADREKGIIRIVFRAGGNGTKDIASFSEGDRIDILGILGNGYDTAAAAAKKVILLGGGIGIPPMLYAAKELKKAGADCVAVLGYADNKLFLKDDFAAVCETLTATMDGSAGVKGNVLDAVRAHGVEGDIIYSCGPMPMLRVVKQYAAEKKMECFISLEERMACGVGACLGCVVKTKEKDHHTHVNNTRICVEGPVFAAESVNI